MKKASTFAKFTKIAVPLAAFFLLVTPLFVFAWVPGEPLIPCGKTGPQDCDFAHLMLLGKNIVDALFIFSIPVVALVFAYAGYLYLTALGSPGQVQQAKKIFTSVLIGFLVMISAWLLVKFIADNLLTEKYKNTDVRLGS